MSLSQQVVCLSKCAFMLFGLFRVDGTAFISLQLYYDTQASIKNALFCIAKTKALDPSRPFYLLQLGDDRLEGLFGVYRTTTNNCNPDLLGMAERSGAAQEVSNILAEHPDCDRKPYRLSLEGASGVDHLNPASWTGDVCVGNVSLRTSWDEGLSQARVSLSQVGIVLDCNPDNLRAAAGGRDVDLMRPWGHYIGVSEPQLGETDTGSSTLVESVPNSSLCPQPNPNGTPNPNSKIINPPADDLSLMDAELPFEELLDPCMPAASEDHVHVPDGPIERGWVQVTEARKIRLESATRLILGTESSEKSTDRLRRVRGFSCYPSATPQSDSILGDFCLVGQPVLGLVRTPHEIALAAVKITSINVSTGTQSSQVESISLEHLNRSDVTLRGQILALEFHDGKWYWNRSYVTTPAKGGKTIAPKAKNLKPLLVDYKACMIEPVNPSLVEREEGLVWSFEHDELVGSTDLLWSKSLANLHSIPMITSSPGFPYQSGNNTHTHTLTHLEASQAIEAMPAERCGLCHLCGYSVPIRHFMRTHIAKHIRAKQRGIEDPLVHGPIGPAACGFCGRSGCCKTLLKVSKKSTSLSSDCEYFDKFSLEPAAKSTNSSPCTNRPIACQHNECLDRDPIWSYNMRGHILARHGESAFNHAVNTGLFMITPQEDKRLQLDNMLMVPGKSPFSLSPPPAVSAKRKINDSSVIGEQATSPIITHSPALTDTSPGASGSQSKRPRLV